MITAEHFPKPAPSFVGSNAWVLVGLAVVGGIAAIVFPLLQNACALGCP